MFRSLLTSRSHLPPGEQQRAAQHEFPAVVAKSHLHWWTLGEPAPQTGRRLLLFVATWSGIDMSILEALDYALEHGRITDIRVDVLDFEYVKTREEFEKYIPGVGHIHHTPIFGYWIDGILTEKGCGHDALKLTSSLTGLNLANGIFTPP
jgi:hypothetical protein